MIYNEVCNLHKEKVMKWWEGRGGEGQKKSIRVKTWVWVWGKSKEKQNSHKKQIYDSQGWFNTPSIVGRFSTSLFNILLIKSIEPAKCIINKRWIPKRPHNAI